MKSGKAGRPMIIAIFAAAAIAVACFHIFRTQNAAGLISGGRADQPPASVTIFKAVDGGDFSQVFSSKDMEGVGRVMGLLSAAHVRLAEWKPLTGDFPILEGVVYAIMMDKPGGKDIVLNYANGYVYCLNHKYRVSPGDVKTLTAGLEALCS